MTRRQANAFTVVGLAALLAAVALTAPRWSGLLSEPLAVFEDDSGDAERVPGAKDPEAELAERRISVRLYFAAEDCGGLQAEERSIAFSDDLAAQLRTVVEELVVGPREGLLPTLPPETRVLEVFTTPRGVAYVNLSADVASEPSGSMAELLSVYSIVDSLVTNFPAIDRVQILVQDEMVTSLAGHVDLSRPLPPDMTLVVVPPLPGSGGEGRGAAAPDPGLPAAAGASS
jgi:spore germination protein GerM